MGTSISIADGRTTAKRRPTSSTAVRNFGAAQVSRFSGDWTTELLTSDDALERDLRKLVARSREQRRNNDLVKHFDHLCRTNIVGAKGISIRPRPLTQKGAIDEDAKKTILEAWQRWSEPEFCDIGARLSWVDQQNLAVSSMVQSGEFLARKIYGPEAGPDGFALQLLDPQSLDPSLLRHNRNGNSVRLGMEFDDAGRVVRYWIRTSSLRTGGLPTFSVAGGRYVGVPADEIVHVFVPEEINQKRGVPWVATSLVRLRMLEAYSEAALIAARAGANKVAFITRARQRGYTGPKDGEGFRTMNAEPGTIEELDEGASLLSWDPPYPSNEFDSFMRRQTQMVAAGLLVSYTTLANDHAESSFSSERSRKLSERDVWRALQSVVVKQLVRPVFLDWLRWKLGTRTLVGPRRVYGASEFDRLSTAVDFVGRTWTWATNPLQEVAAAKLEVDAGFRSRDDVISEQYNRDPVDVDDSIRESQERATAKELALSGPATVAIKVDEGGTDGNE
jgi:lambda family phage portal protein